MKLYTRMGDQGTTGLIGGRVDKDHARVEAYGMVDEVNCFIGQAVVLAAQHETLRKKLQELQHELFDAGADLATVALQQPRIGPDKTQKLEDWIDELSEAAPPIAYFILPGGTALSAALHVCRGVCRRAERAAVHLSKQEEVPSEILVYLNRLSDFFFAAARYANHLEQIADIRYESRK